MKYFFIILFSFLIAGSADAATNYVDSIACTGNYSTANRNCTGSDGSSFTTLAAAFLDRNPGDIVKILSGTWPGVSAVDMPNGTAGNLIVIEGYQSENPIVRYFGRGDKGDVMHGYVHIRNMRVVGLDVAPTEIGIKNFHHSIIENVEVTNHSYLGMSDMHDSTMRNLNVHHNGTPRDPSCTPALNPHTCHGVYTGNAPGGIGNIFEGGEYHHDLTGQGIQCYLRCQDTIIRNVRLHNNGTYGLFMACFDAVCPSDPNNSVYNVLAYNNGTYGLWFATRATVSNVSAYNNGSAGIAVSNFAGITIQNSLILGSVFDRDGLGYTSITNIQAPNSTYASHFTNALGEDFRLVNTSSACWCWD